MRYTNRRVLYVYFTSGVVKSPKLRKFLSFFKKRRLIIKFLQFCSESLHRDTDQRCCVQNLCQFSYGKSVKSCLVYLTKKTKFRLPLKLSLLRGSRLKSVVVSRQHFDHKIPNFIQIGSLSAKL